MRVKLTPVFQQRIEASLRAKIMEELISVVNSPVEVVCLDVRDGGLYRDVSKLSQDPFSEIALLAGDLASIAVRQLGSMCETEIAQQEIERRKVGIFC